MSAIMHRSPEASELDAYARRQVDLVDRDQYDGRMPMDVARDLYVTCVAATAHRYAMDQLAPINRELSKLAAMSLDRLEVPPAVEELRQQIISKWRRAVAELLPQSPPAAP